VLNNILSVYLHKNRKAMLIYSVIVVLEGRNNTNFEFGVNRKSVFC